MLKLTHLRSLDERCPINLNTAIMSLGLAKHILLRLQIQSCVSAQMIEQARKIARDRGDVDASGTALIGSQGMRRMQAAL
jgi:hypothetical protein